MTVLSSQFRKFCGLRFIGKGSSLRDEASALAFPSSVCVFGEEQLWSMQYVHQHRELSLNQGPQTILQSRHDVLTNTHQIQIQLF